MKKSLVGIVVSLVIIVTVILLVVLLNPAKGHAASFDEALSAASANLPLGADVMGMGNIGTLEEFSSNNPAITSIMKEGRISGTGNYGYFGFGKTHLTTLSASLTGKVGDVVLQLGFGHAATPMKQISGDESFRLIQNSVNLQVGGKVVRGFLTEEDELYVGGGYTYSQGVQDGNLLTLDAGGTITDTFSIDTKSHTVALGIAYKPIKRFTLGAYGSRTWTSSEATFNDVKDPNESKSFYDVAHLGFSAKVIDGWTTLAGDVERVSFSDSGTVFNRYYVGVEQYLLKDFLALYAGVANNAPTAGVATYFKHGGLNFAYGHDMLRELKNFLGAGDSFMFSAYFNF